MTDFRDRLIRRFGKQKEFCRQYSPLYARLFGLVESWLRTGQDDEPLAAWLVEAAGGRASFDVPLLLLAGLHRDILAGEPATLGLARYYPTVGGSRPADHPELAGDFRAAILARRADLAAFLRTATVQTNEIARGLCWLLPARFLDWRQFDLVELGASAGLNLVADELGYELIDPGDGRLLLALGRGGTGRLRVASRGPFSSPVASRQDQAIASRLGCDLAPLPVASESEAVALAAYVWGDQQGRMAMLRHGLATLRQARAEGMVVRIHQANLPTGLLSFLQEQVEPLGQGPVVVFNTYLTTYLDHRGASLRPILADWAAQSRRPLLWLQWETLWQGPDPPALGWIAWTADFWEAGQHRCWHLAWTHPHGNEVLWQPDMAAWAAFWNQRHHGGKL